MPNREANRAATVRLLRADPEDSTRARLDVQTPERPAIHGIGSFQSKSSDRSMVKAWPLICRHPFTISCSSITACQECHRNFLARSQSRQNELILRMNSLLQKLNHQEMQSLGQATCDLNVGDVEERVLREDEQSLVSFYYSVSEAFRLQVQPVPLELCSPDKCVYGYVVHVHTKAERPQNQTALLQGHSLSLEAALKPDSTECLTQLRDGNSEQCDKTYHTSRLHHISRPTALPSGRRCGSVKGPETWSRAIKVRVKGSLSPPEITLLGVRGRRPRQTTLLASFMEKELLRSKPRRSDWRVGESDERRDPARNSLEESDGMRLKFDKELSRKLAQTQPVPGSPRRINDDRRGPFIKEVISISFGDEGLLQRMREKPCTNFRRQGENDEATIALLMDKLRTRKPTNSKHLEGHLRMPLDAWNVPNQHETPGERRGTPSHRKMPNRERYLEEEGAKPHRPLSQLAEPTEVKTSFEPAHIHYAHDDIGLDRSEQFRHGVESICDCMASACSDLMTEESPKTILRKLCDDSKELQMYRDIIAAHLQDLKSLSARLGSPQASSDEWPLGEGHQSPKRRLEKAFEGLSRQAEALLVKQYTATALGPAAVSTQSHGIYHEQPGSVEPCGASTRVGRDRNALDFANGHRGGGLQVIRPLFSDTTQHLQRNTLQAYKKAITTLPDDSISKWTPDDLFRTRFRQVHESLEAIASAIDKNSNTTRSGHGAEALADVALCLKEALREQKLSESTIDQIIAPCFTHQDIGTSVRLMVASLQARLESSVYDSVSIHIQSQERLRATARGHSSQSSKEEFVPAPLGNCGTEATNHVRRSTCISIIFEESYRPLLDIVTSLANNREYILCLTSNREAIPYELLLQGNNPEAAASNARALYEAWQRIVASGQTRLKAIQIPRALAFEGCTVKSWDSQGIKFEVTFRAMARAVGHEIVSGSQLREWGSHVLERMRVAVQLYKQANIPPRQDPAYLRSPP